MKTVLKYIAYGLLAVMVAGLITFFFFPGKVVQLTNWNDAYAAGLEKKTITVNGYTTHYYQSKEMDKKETLVLLHGMGDDKSSFLQSAELLSEHYNLVLPDLSGHGENARDPDRNYSIYGQAQFLRNFLHSIDIYSFYLGGNSMGGHTSLSYALNYPDEVNALLLVNAPGVSLDDHVVYGGFGSPLKNKDDLSKILDRIFYKAPDLPSPIANHMIETINNNLDFVDDVLIPSIAKGKDFDLKDRLHQIKAPTLIVWGKHDEVVKFNVAEYFDEAIPNSTLEIIENGSHSPQLEVPEEVGEKIASFLNGM